MGILLGIQNDEFLCGIQRSWYIVSPMARPWSRKKRKGKFRKPAGIKGGGARFWIKNLKNKEHIVLSSNPSEDLVKFTRWLSRQHGGKYLNKIISILDLGCGNGRNLIYLAQQFGCYGVGFDISHEATAQATRLSNDSRVK